MGWVDPRTAADLLQRADWLDQFAKPVASTITKVLPGHVKAILSGAPLGHPAHPLLTDLPIGMWTSALLLDLFGGRRARPAADTLVGVGILAAVPTALTGLADWADLEPRARRVGVAHAVANTVALALQVASFTARGRGHRTRGVALGSAAAAALTVGGYLGGHLAFRLAAGVSRNATADLPEDWTEVADLAELPDRRPVLATAGGAPILLVRRGGDVCALADTCSHLGGPLHEGHLDGDTITCPWHASSFRLADGAVVHGPASAPQPAFDVRTIGGKVEIRRRAAAS